MSLVLVSEAEPHKKCRKCGLTLPHSEFYRQSGCHGGVRSYCKRCHNLNAAANLRRRKEENPNIYRERDREPRRLAHCLWRGAKSRAKKSGMPFGIPFEWAKERIDAGVCEASGVPFCLDTTVRHLLQPSIDRIDNDPAIGYVLGNVRMVVLMVNLARNTCNDDGFFVECFLEVADGLAMKKIHAA